MSMRQHQGGVTTGLVPSARSDDRTANPVDSLTDTEGSQQAAAITLSATGGTDAANDPRLEAAALGLWRAAPLFSARDGIARGQVVALSLLAGTFLGLAVALPEVTLFLLSLLIAVPILCMVVLRTAAILELARPVPAPPPRLGDGSLPVYSILVPLLHEAAVVPRLLKALGTLDYPVDKLDIQLVVESSDPETQGAIASVRLPPHFRVVVVPVGAPRTKPKALNYALPGARGDLLVIYDAEDAPEPDQLRRAAERFAVATPDLVCLQARLAIERCACPLERQFAIEYTALFDALLPALERFGLPVPLGGTSNHFRIETLRAVGAWDPYNVTEDADLGIRFARFGLRVGTLASTTWELAPDTYVNWRNQRTRWLKGWMQTYLVHTRRPRRVVNELGGQRFIGLIVLMGGILLSVLAYPVGLALLASALASGRFLATPETGLEAWLWWASLANLGLGFASSMMLAAIALHRRRRSELLASVPWMPIYWMAISLAGYRALRQLASDPFRWEKTDHGEP